MARLSTPTQLFDDAQDTPNRSPPALPAGSFTGTLTQARPFHCSASPAEVPLALVYTPVATQSADVTQDTPLSAAEVVPAGTGGWATVQVLPFQDSARVAVLSFCKGLSFGGR